MLSIVLVVQALVPGHLPGVWADREGTAVWTFVSASVGRGTVREEFLVLGDITAVPDGTATANVAVGSWPLPAPREVQDSPREGWRPFIKYRGAARLSAATTNADGSLLTLRSSWRPDSELSERAGPTDRIGGLHQVSFAEVYSSLDAGVTLETGARPRAVVRGAPYYVEISRDQTVLLNIRFIDGSSGKVVGQGCAQWDPSPDKVKEFRSGKWGPSDRVLLSVVLHGRQSVWRLTTE